MAATGPKLPPVFVLTDPDRLPPARLTELSLPAGWGVIHRHFGAPGRAADAERLADHCRRNRLIFLVANDPSLALAVRADGVHWPEDEASKARNWPGRFALMTMSWHQRRPVTGLPHGIDAALISTVFSSGSPSAGKPMGAIRARQLARASRVSLFGLGGVGAQSADAISGSMGLAGIEGFYVFGPDGHQPG